MTKENPLLFSSWFHHNSIDIQYQYLNLDLASNIDLLHSKSEYFQTLQFPSFRHCGEALPLWSAQSACTLVCLHTGAPWSSTPERVPPSSLASSTGWGCASSSPRPDPLSPEQRLPPTRGVRVMPEKEASLHFSFHWNFLKDKQCRVRKVLESGDMQEWGPMASHFLWASVFLLFSHLVSEDDNYESIYFNLNTPKK